jgi:hypothetical protein
MYSIIVMIGAPRVNIKFEFAIVGLQQKLRRVERRLRKGDNEEAIATWHG